MRSQFILTPPTVTLLSVLTVAVCIIIKRFDLSPLAAWSEGVKDGCQKDSTIVTLPEAAAHVITTCSSSDCDGVDSDQSHFISETNRSWRSTQVGPINRIEAKKECTAFCLLFTRPIVW